MTANKHTPGPWHVGFADDSGPGYITTFDSGLVVVRGGYANGLKFGAIRKSDARLIAAAPELLEALNMVFARLKEIEICNDISIPHELKESARAAIEKATGGAE